MTANARVVAGTLVVLTAAAYLQLNAHHRAKAQYDRAVPFTIVIEHARTALAQTPHRDLYAASERYGFVLVGDVPEAARNTLYQSVRYALAPAVVTPDPDAERVVVVVVNPADAAAFDAAGRFRLLDRLTGNVALYQRGGN